MIRPLDLAFDETVAALRDGGVVAVPTDTVYGLAALPGIRSAMARLFACKRRADNKSIAVLVADLEQAETLTGDDLARFAPLWPGPLTVVVRRRADVVLHLGADDTTVGIRCPDHDFVLRLARELGPIAASSANLAGEPTAATAAMVASVFPDLDLVVDGGRLDAAGSTVVDATVQPPRLLREGPIRAADLGL